MPTDILIVISGANLVTLLGLLGKVWSWSNHLEGRLTAMEAQMKMLIDRDASRMQYSIFQTPKESK